MKQWEIEGRTLHTFINDCGFGVIVPLTEAEAQMPTLMDRLQTNMTEVTEQGCTLCAYATGFEDISTDAAHSIDFTLRALSRALRANCENAHAMSIRFRKENE